MNNHWDTPFTRVEREANLEEEYRDACEVLNGAETQLMDFVDTYPQEEIQRDLQYTTIREKQFHDQQKKETAEQKRNRMLAVILEAIIYEHGELSDWFGPNSEMMKASRYDDIHHGVDSIVELQEGEKKATHLALGIDVTSSHEAEEKFHRIKKEIDDGHLAEIKYFESEYMEMKGKMQNIPRVIIGADQHTIVELMNMIKEKKFKDLANHPIQFQILELMADQLKVFIRYAESLSKRELVLIYEKALKSIHKIMKAKGPMPRGGEKRDSTFGSLNANLSWVFKERK
jgi:hypothetical protein